ncbi:MAG: hypothetical protein MI745_09775 [Pseudomonadales bacterium]|nr:hypothetical protein [Pseudomonadales bacterium]
MKRTDIHNTDVPERVESRQPDLNMPAMPPLAMMDALDHRIRLAWYRLRKSRAEQRARVTQRLQRKPV